MMPSINQAFENALLANATYQLGESRSGVAGATLRGAIERTLTPVLADYISQNYTAVSNIDYPELGTSGFDATAWRHNVTGKIYVSLEGTVPGPADLVFTDLPLALNGNAGQQVLDMINWWLQITTPVGQMARQIRPAESEVGDTYLVEATEVAGQGLISAAELQQGVEVSGHSLGGYLATAFTRLFGAQAHVSHTFTFNSAGFAPGSEAAFAAFQDAVGPGYGLGRFPTQDEQTNYFAGNGFNFTTNSLYFDQQGKRVALFNEQSTLPTGNHSMYKLTDLLALGAAMEKLDPTLTTAKLNQLIMQASNYTAGSYEGLLDGLRRLILGPQAPLLGIADSDDSDPTRVAYHQAVRDLQSDAGFTPLVGKLTLQAVSGSLASQAQARVDFQTFAALHTLSPFVANASGAQGQAVLDALWQSSAWSSLHAAWIADKSLSAVDRAAGKANFTDQWMADRAEMLAMLIARNREDWPSQAIGVLSGSTRAASWFDQQTNRSWLTGISITESREQVYFGDDRADTFNGGLKADRIYGGGGADTLSGLGGNDYLEGNAGIDTLNGGAGNDTLLGGTGADTYRFEGAFGRDIVLDQDGKGRLLLDGVQLPVGKYLAPNLWRSSDAKVTYTLSEADSAGRTQLTVSFTGRADNLVLLDWSAASRNLGISLQAAPIPTPATTSVLRGDFQKAVQPGNPAYFVLGANGYVSAGSQPGAADFMLGTPGASDDIQTFGGNDYINAGDKADLVDGGEGADLIVGGGGADTLLGGGGNDFIIAGRDATISAPATAQQAQQPVPQGYTLDAAGFGWNAYNFGVDSDGFLRGYYGPVLESQGLVDSGTTANFVDAGAGNDVVHGGHGPDVLLGGDGSDDLYGLGGADVLSGGLGRDRIHGDARADAPYLLNGQWVQLGTQEWLASGDVIDGGAGSDLLIGQAGHDTLIGGADDDVLYGDDRDLSLFPVALHGDDLLDGGAGHDELTGGAGSDWLSGGDGGDFLWGDSGAVPPGDAGYFDAQFHGADTLHGGAGDDELYGEAGDDVLFGGAGNDLLFGDGDEAAADAAYHGVDRLEGGEGDDYLEGSGGADVLLGGMGADTLYGGSGDDILDGGDGIDAMYGGGGSDHFVAGAGEWRVFDGVDTLLVDLVDATAGQDTLELQGADINAVQVTRHADGKVYVTQGGVGVALVAGLTSSVEAVSVGGSATTLRDLVNDRLQAAVSASSTRPGGNLLGGAVADSLTARAADAAVVVSAGGGDDTVRLLSTSGATLLVGQVDGTDTLFAVQRTPGAKNVLVLDSGFVPESVRLVWGDWSVWTGQRSCILSLGLEGEGLAFGIDNYSAPHLVPASAWPIDEIRFADNTSMTMADVLAQGVLAPPSATAGDDKFTLTQANDTFFAYGGDDVIDGSFGNDRIFGGEGSDSLYGGNGDDWLEGEAGSDRLYGGEGADTMVANIGSDSMFGGEGADTYTFSGATASASDEAASDDRYEVTVWQGAIQSFTSESFYINDLGGNDALVAGAGVAPADIVVVNDGNNLVLRQGSGYQANRVYLQNAVGTGGDLDQSRMVEELRFSNGVVWSIADLVTRSLRTTSGPDEVRGYGGIDVIDGLAGDDQLYGASGNDELVGGAGNDFIHGGSGDDVLRAGADGGSLVGGQGNDRYEVGRNEGRVLVGALPGQASDDSGFDRLILSFAKSEVAAALERDFAQDGRDALVLRLLDGTTEVAVWLAGEAGSADTGVDVIEFTGGTTARVSSWVATFMQPASSGGDTIVGTSFGEELFGADGDDHLIGRLGADRLFGGKGVDTLEGGGGGDYLDGGPGNDTIEITGSSTIALNSGGGTDRVVAAFASESEQRAIVVDAAYGPSDLAIRWKDWSDGVYDTMRVSLPTSDAIEFGLGLPGYENRGGQLAVNVVKFSNGVTWGISELVAKANQSSSGDDVLIDYLSTGLLDGGAGNDKLVAGFGPTTLIGGAGDDLLEAYRGSVTYKFELGFGNDRIRPVGGRGGSDLDKIEFGEGIAPEDVAVLSKPYGALALFHRGSNGMVTLDAFLGQAWPVQGQVSFANGVVWDFAELAARVSGSVGSSGADYLQGSAGNDTMLGLEGDDTVLALEGNDVLIGGPGQDQLYGGLGDDTYRFNLGDGVDTLRWEFDDRASLKNVLEFGAGILPTDISFTRVSANHAEFGDTDWALRLSIRNTSDAITAQGMYWLDDASNRYSPLQQVRFADVPGTVWSVADMLAMSLRSSAGDDTLIGTNAVENISGGGGRDFIDGRGGNDTLNGEAGNDTLLGGAGRDVLDGGSGNDSLNGGLGDNLIHFARTGGQDVIRFTHEVRPGKFNLLQLGAAVLPADVLLSRAADTQASVSNGALRLAISGTTDHITINGFFYGENPHSGYNPVQAVRFADGTVWDVNTLVAMLATSTVNGTANAETLNGTANADKLNGLAGNDTLNGAAGNDLLDGGAGTDTLKGNAGNDVLVVDATADVVTELANEGNDTVRSSVTLTLAANAETLVLTGTAAINGTGNSAANLIIGNAANNVLNGGTGADTLFGGAGNDSFTVDNAADVVVELLAEGTDTLSASVNYTLPANVENLTFTGSAALVGTGNELANTLTGNTGNNTLYGGLGNDTLNGGAGVDVLVGGQGNDKYQVDTTTDTLTELPNEGTDDEVISTVTYTLGANIERLTLGGSSAINGTGNGLNNVLVGNAAANTLIGGDGADTLNGGAGNDNLQGGAGDDVYVVDAAGDVLTEAAGAGIDRVESIVTWTLGANFENLLLAGSGAINGTGNALGNWMVGNGAANVLKGLGGDDTLDGGLGNDTMEGGAGDDIYVINVATDIVTELANQGIDKVRSPVLYTLPSHVEHLELFGTAAVNGTGNALDNWLSGNSANNTLTGLGGNDEYFVQNAGDVIVEAAGGGHDGVTASLSWTLGANLEDLVLTGTGAFTGTGNAFANYLQGNDGDNTLTGLAGNDQLNGGGGSDTLVGGSGDDKYDVQDYSDTIVELAGEGWDTIRMYTNNPDAYWYTLPANVEELDASQDGLNHYLGGNELNNTLVGGVGNDTLNGQAGVDAMRGGAGDDTYYVHEAGDVVSEQAGQGNDTVVLYPGDWAFNAYTAPAEVEDLDASDHWRDMQLTGNALANRITGSVQGDALAGLAGNDTLLGGAGGDTYHFARNGGVDTVVESDTTAGVVDRVQWAADILYSQVSYARVGNDLQARIAASPDMLVVKDWYLGSAFQVEEFRHANGQVTTAAQLQNLVQAMASFSGGGAAALSAQPDVRRYTPSVNMAVPQAYL